jgi:hypothetical protein
MFVAVSAPLIVAAELVPDGDAVAEEEVADAAGVFFEAGVAAGLAVAF